MKILISAGTVQSLAGFRMPLLRFLRDAGHEVHACAADDDACAQQRVVAEGIVFHPVSIQRASLTPLGDVVYAGTIYALVRSLGIQGYLAYTHKPICLGLPAAAAAGARVRVALVTGLGYAFVSADTVHRRFVRSAVHLLYRQALPRATHLYFQNTDDQADFDKVGLLDDAPEPRVVAGSGVPLDEFPVCPVPPPPPVFLMLSRLLADKGVREYAAAAAVIKRSHPEARFLLAGSFDSNPTAITKKEVASWVRSGCLEYLGVLDDVRPALRACSICVLPSYREGTPRSVLEAMAVGRPVLTTDAPGCRETLLNLGPPDVAGIRRADNGISVPIANAGALAAAMAELADCGERLSVYGCASRLYAEQRYDANKISAQLASAFSV